MPDAQQGGAAGEQTAGADDQQKAITYLKRALVELSETRQRLREAEDRLTEPIAIVGMGCRYPGGVRSPEDLWELLVSGTDAISELPDDRGWDLEMLPGPDPDDPAVRFKGGFIEYAGDFDAEFFGIDDEAAHIMDPQQRLLLETTWEACEYAGLDPNSLRGSDTGVFMGVGALGYGLWLLGAVSESAEGHYSLGNAGSMTSGRLAHALKLEGPAFTLDTACSSSSVALHLACQSLRQRDCSMALAGGAAIIGTPWIYLEFSRQKNFGIAPDGRCKSFADGADGAGFSEGIGVVLLERLSDACRLGHEVLAVVRGSAFNQDGASNGLTAPNGLAHEKVIRQALRNAGLSAHQVDAVEAHGMGTVLGDPIEAQALIAAYGRDREDRRPLWLGSMKSNLGHTQSAGGVGAVIKMVMAMRQGLLPKTLHVDSPSRHIDWSGGAVSLLVDPVPWSKEGEEPRRAAVHSFGMSGTNVHIVLEEGAPIHPIAGRGTRARPPVLVLWPISGHGQDGLLRQARRLLDFLCERPQFDAADVGRSLALTRPHFAHRACVIGQNSEDLLEGLAAIAEEQPASSAVVEGIAPTRTKVAFVFSAGDQRLRERAAVLLETTPGFFGEIERVEDALRGRLQRPLRDALNATPAPSGAEAHEAIIDFALSVALAALWRGYGVEPAALLGVGRGELAAAYVAGALTLEEALAILAGEPLQKPSHDRSAAILVPLWLASLGGPVDASRLDGVHWSRALGEPARPESSVRALLAQGLRAFLEIGSASLGTAAIGDGVVFAPALPGKDPASHGIASTLARLWVAGVTVGWKSVFAEFEADLVRLPTYAFAGRRYWIEQSPLWAADGPMVRLHQHPVPALNAGGGR
jgi:acyl transferase domain-containing protein